MNHLAKLEDLRDNVRYWEWLFDISDKSNARQRLEGLKIARQHLKNHKGSKIRSASIFCSDRQPLEFLRYSDQFRR